MCTMIVIVSCLKRENLEAYRMMHGMTTYLDITRAQAWMRSRGDSATEVFTAETMAAKFGVEEGSYDAVPLPRLDAHAVTAHSLTGTRPCGGRHAQPSSSGMRCSQRPISRRPCRSHDRRADTVSEAPSLRGSGFCPK